MSSFKNRLLAFFANGIMRLIVKSCHVDISGIEYLHQAVNSPNSSIISFWHGSMFIVPALLGPYAKKTNFVACISKSRDADVLEQVIYRYPPSTCIRIGKARAAGLLEMIREVEKGGRILLVTPDGPKGPHQVIKEGMLEISKKTGAPIYTLSWNCSSVFKLPTWDKFQIPRPFSKIQVIISYPDPAEIASGLNA